MRLTKSVAKVYRLSKAAWRIWGEMVAKKVERKGREWFEPKQESKEQDLSTMIDIWSEMNRGLKSKVKRRMMDASGRHRIS